jgi:glycosyltransferase involved in cell wall biosynthesis
MKKKIVILYNTSWGLYNFRKNLIKTLLERNFKVIAIAPEDEFTNKLHELGCEFYTSKLDSKSKNPVMDLKYCLNTRKIFKQSKPDLILNFTAKPNIYATLVAKAMGIPVINNIAGLGLGFTSDELMAKLLVFLYKLSQKRANHVFFQNIDDQELFLKKGIIKNTSYSLLPGSGVDLSSFNYTINTNTDSKFVSFLLFSRMLYSKGVFVLLEASKLLYNEGFRNFEVKLVGNLGINNSDAISKEDLGKWSSEPFVQYLGGTDNVLPFIQNSDCVVLPSYYREGTPRGILESLSVGRPIITTDMPGCRNTVIQGENGFIVKPRDIQDLADKMKMFLNLSQSERLDFGKRSRLLAEEIFDEKIVLDKYMDEINRVLN